MYFEIISEITNVQVIAIGNKIKDLARLRKQYGDGRWRKLKGVALVRWANGTLNQVEVHWYEAHGIGKRKIKIKRILD